jgi:hypothetical protein
MEISRRARDASATGCCPNLARLSPEADFIRQKRIAPIDVYSVASRTYGAEIQAAGQVWHATADHFAANTSPKLHSQVDELRRLLALDLSAYVRAAADEADETARDLATVQRLKVKSVVDAIEKMLQRRRRRFRWVRRGLWLGVEWVLVGFMWYVWFMVVILRVVFGVGKGVVKGVRWLLWL